MILGQYSMKLCGWFFKSRTYQIHVIIYEIYVIVFLLYISINQRLHNSKPFSETHLNRQTLLLRPNQIFSSIKISMFLRLYAKSQRPTHWTMFDLFTTDKLAIMFRPRVYVRVKCLTNCFVKKKQIRCINLMMILMLVESRYFAVCFLVVLVVACSYS